MNQQSFTLLNRILAASPNKSVEIKIGSQDFRSEVRFSSRIYQGDTIDDAIENAFNTELVRLREEVAKGKGELQTRKSTLRAFLGREDD